MKGLFVESHSGGNWHHVEKGSGCVCDTWLSVPRTYFAIVFPLTPFLSLFLSRFYLLCVCLVAQTCLFALFICSVGVFVNVCAYEREDCSVTTCFLVSYHSSSTQTRLPVGGGGNFLCLRVWEVGDKGKEWAVGKERKHFVSSRALSSCKI